MSVATYILGILAALVVIIVAFEMLRLRKLKERHAIWWLTAGLLTLIVAIFPASIEWLSSSLGVAVSTNLLFFIAIVTLGLLSLQQSTELAGREEEVRILTEEQAMLHQRLSVLESRLSSPESGL